MERAGHSTILLCTLGASWAVIPEIYGFAAPSRLPLYARHPRRAELEALRRDLAAKEPEELWLVTSRSERTREALEQLRAWWDALGAPGALRTWIAAGTDALASPQEIRALRELLFRVTLLARERARPGGLLLSLAGGRKTMSADLQMAGSILGADALLHVIGPEPLPRALREAEPALFAAPLEPDLAAQITPVLIGRGQLDDNLAVPIEGGRIESARFPVPLAEPQLEWTPPEQGPWLCEAIDERRRASGRLLRNFVSSLASADPFPGWTSLLRLPPDRVEELRRTRLEPGHRELLRALPKIDLHRHLGGCLALADQREVARVIRAASSRAELEAARAALAPLLSTPEPWAWDWPEQLDTPPPPEVRHLPAERWRALLAATLLDELEPDRLERELWGATEPRFALGRTHAHGFAAYERPGVLTGSAVLGHPAALAPYVAALLADARADGLIALELRGSPHKYARHDPLGFVCRLRAALIEAGARVDVEPAAAPPSTGEVDDRLRVGFVWIVDRRARPEDARPVIEAAARAHAAFPGFVLGVDLAGDERTSSPEQWAPLFEPLFRECVFLTVHAGEGERAANIWEAAYRLHADRIGHGLALLEDRALLAKVRERGICLELCPTANLEVVGFRDPALPESEGCPPYPLRDFLREEVPVTLCTDNPGISRTTLTDEFLTAARITPDGLTFWEALSLIRRAFVASFLPVAERRRLLQRADAALGELLAERCALQARSAAP